MLLSILEIPIDISLSTFKASCLPKFRSLDLKPLWLTRSSWLNCALRDDEDVYWVSIGHYEAVEVGDTGSVEGIYAFIYCTKWRSGRVSRMPDRQTLKDRATQLLTKYKSGALVTQCNVTT